MASPRRRRLKKMLRAGLLKAKETVEAVVEAVTPVVEEAKAAPKKATYKENKPSKKK